MLPRWTALLAPAFLLAQAALVHVSAGSERPPKPPALAEFPAQINQWTEQREDPIDPDVLHTLGADRLLSRTYQSRGAALPVSLLVAWFQSQRAGASQPHSPKVCLPASGWQTESTGRMTIATSAGPITVNRYVVGNRRDRAVVLYWYQDARGAVAGEWASKFWTVVSALRDRRTDLALVRLVVEEGAGDGTAQIQQATGDAAEFAREVYPVLRTELPR
ncbi:MAG TPA: EpsI family protein [Bryobacteraceae bacterium]|nr:EpsI family protein [Bryobacteraceae bacterium]